MSLLADLSAGLRLPPRYIAGWASKASHAYSTYTIPKKDGGTRIIHHPSRQLKSFQRWILRHVLEPWPVHPAAVAYRQGRSIFDNAVQHASSRFLLKLDLAEFFPSIRGTDIRAYLTGGAANIGDWTPPDVELFVALVCRDGRLTIGAPTSPALSNALMYDFDCRCAAMAEELRISYTRYADDMFLSSSRPGVLSEAEQRVRDILAGLTVPADLRLNAEKTRHLSRRKQRVVTGLVIGSAGEVGIGRARKRFIRRQLHKFRDLTPAERSQLRGLLAYVRGVEPDLINALVMKYGALRVSEASSYAGA